MKYCSNCGKEIQEGADICLSCGKILEKKQEKNGSKIASMVLGIISLLWILSALSNIEAGIITLAREINNNFSLVYFISYYIGYTLFALTPGIVGLILGIKSNKKIKSKMALSGIIMTIISLFGCFYIFVRFIAVFFL